MRACVRACMCVSHQRDITQVIGFQVAGFLCDGILSALQVHAGIVAAGEWVLVSGDMTIVTDRKA